MKDFRRIITPSGHETYGGRANRPDDVIMGMSMGVWRGVHQHEHSLLRDPNQ